MAPVWKPLAGPVATLVRAAREERRALLAYVQPSERPIEVDARLFREWQRARAAARGARGEN